MSLTLPRLRGYLSRYGDEHGNILMKLFDENLGNIDKIAHMMHYGVNKALETAYRLADPKAVKQALRSYGRGFIDELEILERNLKHSFDIANYFKVTESRYLGRFKEYLVKAREFFYRGYVQKGFNLLQNVVSRLETMKGPVPDYERLVKGAGKAKQQLSVARVVPMIAILGFFSIFLYSMSPSATGQAFAFSEFNLFLTGVFTLITLVALYLVYKM